MLPPIKLPIDKKWPQLNKGDLLGALAYSRNIDLNEDGILSLSQRTRYFGQTTSNYEYTLSIVYGAFADYYRYYFVTSDKIWQSKYDLSNFTQDATANSPTLYFGSDGTTWNSAGTVAMYVSKTLRVSKLSNNAWTSDWSGTNFDSANNYHPLEPNVTNVNLLAGDGSILKAIDSSGAVTTAITLPDNLNIRWIRRGNSVNYIGCEGKAGGRGAIVVWDGLPTTTGANSIIYLDTVHPLSGLLDEEGTLNVITSDGRLLKFNGNGMSYLAELPPFNDYELRFNWGGTLNAGSGITQRGTTLIRGKIHVVLDASGLSSDAELMYPQFQSGVWVYDDGNKAFYHKSSPSNSNTVTDFGQSHGTGMISAISPIFIDYAFSLDPSASVGGSYITGPSLYPNTVAGTVLRTAVSVTTGINRGYFSTTRIESQNISDSTLALWCKYQNVSSVNDKIIFKFRTSKRDPFVITNSVATWINTTSFTSTDTKIANARAGDEITVLTGNGAGCTAHITVTPTLSTGTYTVTLDEAIVGVSANDTAYIMFDSWTKLTTQITNTDTDGYKRIPITYSGNPKWIQIKCEMRGEGRRVAIEELSLINSTKISNT